MFGFPLARLCIFSSNIDFVLSAVWACFSPRKPASFILSAEHSLLHEQSHFLCLSYEANVDLIVWQLHKNLYYSFHTQRYFLFQYTLPITFYSPILLYLKLDNVPHILTSNYCQKSFICLLSVCLS